MPNFQDAHTIESPPMSTPPEIVEGFSGDSPSDRATLVEVIMPPPMISTTTKRANDSTDLSRIDRTKRARCVVGSSSIRIINQIHVSTPTTQKSPRTRSSIAQKSSGEIAM